MLSDVVMTFFTSSRARGARRDRLATAAGWGRARMTLTRRGAATVGHRAGLRGTLRAWAPPAALSPDGHGGVGVRAVPATRRTGEAPQRSAPSARAAKRAILPALQCEARQRSPARALRVTRDGLRPPLRLIFPGIPWRLSEGWPGMEANSQAHVKTIADVND